MVYLLSRASRPGYVAGWTTDRCVRISGATSHYEDYRLVLKEVPCPALALPRLLVHMLWLQGRRLGATALYMRQRFAELLLDSAA